MSGSITDANAVVGQSALAYKATCPSGQIPKLNSPKNWRVCEPIKCSCNEQKINGECAAMEPKTTWDTANDAILTYPKPNHSDALQTLPNGIQINQCFVSVGEKDGIANGCPPQTANPIDCATGQKKVSFRQPSST